MRLLWAVLSISLLAASALAQQSSHELHHTQYQQWQSNDGFGCCNDQDCGTLGDDHVRETTGRIEVLIDDPKGAQWCPVSEGMLIDQRKGIRPSPDWSRAHACILSAMDDRQPCERLKCFMEKVRG